MTGYPHLAVAFTWQDRAACKDKDAALFFAPESESATARKRRETKAKAICSGCAVRTDCLEWRLASEYQLDGGIWGMAGEDERTRIRTNRLRTAARRAAA